ncbi:MAG: tetratricopeptide repeat protein [Deltaproteobacteria bacterium]|nr:tetratricopeptide repeat protein [Deltaproteobacteria bacterium]
MARTLYTIIWLLMLVFPAYASETNILDIRTGLHEEYHRFVVELSKSVRYSVKREGSVVTVTMLKVRPDYPSDKLPSTDYLRVKTLKGDMDGAIPAARLEVAVIEGAEVKQTNWSEPFRIVLDVYPGKDRTRPNAKKILKDTLGGPAQPGGIDGPSEELLKAAGRTVTFNSGWRWIYRKKLMKTLTLESATDEAVMNMVFKNELGLTAGSKEELLKEADALISAMEAAGDPAALEVLRAITGFFEERTDPSGLETALRLNPDTGFKDLGLFMLGGYYETKGFMPEARGYYSKVLGDKTGRLIHSASVFQRARLFFRENKYEEAKKLFEKAYGAGFPGADLWLADTLLIKGELEQSWDIFSKVKNTDELDPVSLMSLGDIYIKKGNYGGAKTVFEKLRLMYVKDELMTTFFALKAGDAMLAEGRKKEAETSYTKIKSMLKGEEWAIASLSLADSLVLGDDNESLNKAEELYRKVANGDHLGREVTHLSLIRTLTRLGRFREAMDEVESFPKDFRTSRYRMDIQQLTGKLVFDWIEDNYSKGDYAAVVEVGTRYGKHVPFGKKAESFLKIGKSFVAVGIYTDAIESLDSASKMGNGGVAEEAMMELGRVYLNQKDTASTERLYKAFLLKFPKSDYTDEVSRILLKTAFLEEDYGEVAGSKEDGDPETVVLRARSLARLGRHAFAAGLFEKAAARFEAKGDLKKTAAAHIGSADSNYLMGNFRTAVERYRSAAGMLPDGDEDKSWALYRTAQCYSRLKSEKGGKETVTDLMEDKGGYGRWAGPIFATTPKSF